jgi:hypothetical protein
MKEIKVKLVKSLLFHYIFSFKKIPNSCCLFSGPGEREYYEKQFETLQSFAEADAFTAAGEIDDEEELFETKQDAHSELLMKVSNYANIVLLAFKVRPCSLYVSMLPCVFLLNSQGFI